MHKNIGITKERAALSSPSAAFLPKACKYDAGGIHSCWMHIKCQEQYCCKVLPLPLSRGLFLIPTWAKRKCKFFVSLTVIQHSQRPPGCHDNTTKGLSRSVKCSIVHPRLTTSGLAVDFLLWSVTGPPGHLVWICWHIVGLWSLSWNRWRYIWQHLLLTFTKVMYAEWMAESWLIALDCLKTSSIENRCCCLDYKSKATVGFHRQTRLNLR